MSLHEKTMYGESAPDLDELFERYTEADVLAEARRYRDEDRNRRVEQLGVEYDRAKDQALKARMHSVEVVAVGEAV